MASSSNISLDPWIHSLKKDVAKCTLAFDYEYMYRGMGGKDESKNETFMSLDYQSSSVVAMKTKHEISDLQSKIFRSQGYVP